MSQVLSVKATARPAAGQDNIAIGEASPARRSGAPPRQMDRRVARGGRGPLTLERSVLLVLILGVAWRLGRWALGMPLWGDEAMLGLNVLQRSYGALTEPLDHGQIAPVLFLWGQRAAIDLMGAGDRAVRVIPTVASVAALLLFHRLARRSVSPVAAAVATGLLAAAYYACRHGSEFKPYSIDLLASVLITSLTLDWIARPAPSLTPLALCLAVPVLIGVSNPAVFVAGGHGDRPGVPRAGTR